MAFCVFGTLLVFVALLCLVFAGFCFFWLFDFLWRICCFAVLWWFGLLRLAGSCGGVLFDVWVSVILVGCGFGFV